MLPVRLRSPTLRPGDARDTRFARNVLDKASQSPGSLHS